jgi:TolA-binding protein
MTYAAASSYNAAYQTVVPVDVYQEVVADLQEAQSMIRSLEDQNREMWKENQQLQQEISRFLGSVNQFQRGSDGSVNVPSQRVASIAPNQQPAEITDRDEVDNGEMNIWNIIITVLCIIAVGASVGYSAFRPSK